MANDYIFEENKERRTTETSSQQWKVFVGEGEKLKIKFLRPNKPNSPIPEVRHHFIDGRYMMCEACTAVWDGSACAFFKAKVASLVEQGFAYRAACKEARARTSFLYPVVASLIKSNGDEVWLGSRIFQTNFTDGGPGGNIHRLWKSTREKCLCNMGEIKHEGWICASCKKDKYLDISSATTKSPCGSCMEITETIERVSCTNKCGAPARASIYDCIWTVEKVGKFHSFDRSLFGYCPDRFKEPAAPIDWRSKIQWAPQEAMLAAARLSGGGSTAAKGPQLTYGGETNDTDDTDDIPF